MLLQLRYGQNKKSQKKGLMQGPEVVMKQVELVNNQLYQFRIFKHGKYQSQTENGPGKYVQKSKYPKSSCKTWSGFLQYLTYWH